MIKIKILSNDWLVMDTIEKQEICIEEKDGTDIDLEHNKALRELFYTIKELLSEYYSKHNKYNLRFDIVNQEEKIVEVE
jgi:hypothetical protein